MERGLLFARIVGDQIRIHMMGVPRVERKLRCQQNRVHLLKNHGGDGGIMVTKDKNQVYMCMSCGNCKRKDENNGTFSFSCSCGDFPIDAFFASRIEFVGCRSWKPADDNYNEPYLIKIDEKHRTVEIGQWGRAFVELSSDELSDIASCYENEDEGFGAMVNNCKEAYGV